MGFRAVRPSESPTQMTAGAMGLTAELDWDAPESALPCGQGGGCGVVPSLSDLTRLGWATAFAEVPSA
jgi:hypothetical protein